jgi:uncharacterized protein YfaS (alpha-2-macroglobulin family)
VVKLDFFAGARMDDIERRSTRKALSLFSVVAIIIALGLFTRDTVQSAGTGRAAIATYIRGTLHLTIPYQAADAGAGRLTIEVLDPEDNILGQTQRRLDLPAGTGRWNEEVKLEKPLPLEDLVWQRVRYKFDYENQSKTELEGTESISAILRTPVVHILGQQSYLSGGQAAVRIIVTDSQNETIHGPGSVRVELLGPSETRRHLFTGQLNRRGTTEAQFRFPAGVVGSYQLRYVVDSAIGSTEFTQQVRLEDKASILLTTEKPIYQPGQTIHARALALDRASHQAVGDRRLVFELEDSRGNKVFKKTTQTDKFGIASVEFALADEVNLGTYHLRALMGEGESPTNTAELALNVEKYVLPKFKVSIDLGNGKGRHGYRPGDHVTGTVRANYFFGKPVDDAEITIKASGMDVSLFDAGSVQGKTNHDGEYRFDVQLASYFVGRPLTHGTARVLVEATVKDSAGHSETRGAPITVSESPLVITAVPEGGTLVPNLENQVFILTSHPDGTPARTDLKVSFGDSEQQVSTDDGGVGIVSIKADTGDHSIAVKAGDREGNVAATTVPLEGRSGEDQILLRMERAVYRSGERIQLRVFSTKERGTAYIDIVKDGQTILTRDLDIAHGQAEFSLAATPELAGVVDFNAYLFGRDAQPVGDHRLVFVQPADELKIEAAGDSAVYKPGDDAHVRLRVTNAHGEGVSAALGLQVVDEAVFALAEKQPGFAKVFFYLEQEAMKPRYEIHSIGMPEIVEPVEQSKAEQRDRAARALFSATELVGANKFESEFGRAIPVTKYWDYVTRYRKSLVVQAHRVAEAINSAYGQSLDREDINRVIAKVARTGQFRDAWDNKLQIEPVNWDRRKTYYMLHSAGPDKHFNTNDDLSIYLQVESKRRLGPPTSGTSSVEATIEHDRGPFNGRSEITGSAIDQWGEAVAGATAELTETSSEKMRLATTNAEGEFRFGALDAGKYRLRILTKAETIEGNLRLGQRDRAIVTAFLRHQPASSMVVVKEDAGVFVLRAPAMAAGVAGGVPGGQMGGVVGGVIADAPVNGRDALQMARNATEVVEVEAAAPAVLPIQTRNSAALVKDEKQGTDSAPRVRSYFPEALYINPEVITDGEGRASISIPLADSITTWHMAMLASTVHGALGSATSSLRVFQDFFVDLDLPVTLTQGDRVSIPVAIYNYSGSGGDVSLKLAEDDWFTMVDDVAEKSVSVDSARVGGSQFTIEAKRIGKFKLTLSAKMKMNGESSRADIVIREIEVIPNGREQNVVFNGRLENSVQHEIKFPPNAIPDASKIFVRLYPGPLSQIVEGMDKLLQMPFGCFEQTSSVTYPNVLALDYMKRTKKLTPEVHAKAEGYIANGYQRLLTFEVPGGGFSWFGNAPANKILTAYGLMEFSDMSKVYDIDPKVISRTQQWLAGQQQADGSWKPDASFINEGATNRFNKDQLRITAYVAWSLENTGYQGPAVDKARRYVSDHMGEKADAYTLAVVANFAVDYGKDREFTRHAMQLLVDARTEHGEQSWWSADETGVYSTGESATIETTGLALQALLKWGEASGTARTALNYIAAKKGASGTWGTTQATIMALRALLLATEKSTADVHGTVEVLLNDKTIKKLTLTSENNDLLHQFVLKGVDVQEANTVSLRFDGKGRLAYQIVGSYFLPWGEKPANEPLSINVSYDRTHLAQDDVATATATIKNNLDKSANMVMVDLGIPPGFDLLSEDLQAYIEKNAGRKSGHLEKFTQTATLAILYFDSLAPGSTVTLGFRLHAKYPIRAYTFRSRVYEYYDPDVSAVARPIQLEIKRR